MTPGLQVSLDLNREILRSLGVAQQSSGYALFGVGLTAGEGLLVLLLTYIAARLARAFGQRLGNNARLDPQLVLLVGRLVYLAVVVIGFVTFLMVVEPSWVPPLLGGVGLLGLAFGLAFQDVLKNFLSGVFLLLERPFHLGDEITVASFSGTVETILLRVTVLRTAEGLKVLLPNQQVYNSAIINTTGYPRRQFVGAVTVPVTRTLEGLPEAATEKLAAIAGIADAPPPVVALVPNLQFGPTLEARYWLDYREHDAGAIQRAVNSMLLRIAGGTSTVATGPVAEPPAPRRRTRQAPTGKK